MKNRFESMFDPAMAEGLGDEWGHRWRASQKLRFSICLDILKPVLLQNDCMKVLDIGCALGDFTIPAWKVNSKNEFWGTDISANAMKALSYQYPNLHWAVAALPTVPFQQKSFDCIICLEVLSYLNSEERRQSVEEMHLAMRQNGALFLSVWFSGNWMKEFATQAEAKADIIQLVSEYFEIQQIAYNYARLYSAVETKLRLIRTQLRNYSRLIRTSDTEYKQWRATSDSRLKSGVLSLSRGIVSRIPFTKPLICGSLNLKARIIQIALGWTFIAALLFRASKWSFGDDGQTHIIILATKRSP